MGRGDLLIVAGEASGDQHGARLLRELRRLVPEIEPFGLGGDELQAAGLDSVAHSGQVAVVGISEALRVLSQARRIFRALIAEVERRRPEVAVLIDFPEFNLRLARALRRRGVRIVYYVSPQVWAWRKGRVRQIARLVERMLVLLPFEVDFYRQRGVEAIHVGHPLVEEVPRGEHIWEREAGPPWVISLLPGSRRSEIVRLLPVLMGAARRIAAVTEVRFRLIRAPGVPSEALAEAIAAGPQVEVIASDRRAALARSHLALCASGTATLEVALVGTPMLVVYRVSFLSYLAGLLLVRLPYVSLVNLVLGRAAVPELLQNEATPERIAREALALLGDPDRVNRMRDDFQRLRAALGSEGASRRAALEVRDVLEG